MARDEPPNDTKGRPVLSGGVLVALLVRGVARAANGPGMTLARAGDLSDHLSRLGFGYPRPGVAPIIVRSKLLNAAGFNLRCDNDGTCFAPRLDDELMWRAI